MSTPRIQKMKGVTLIEIAIVVVIMSLLLVAITAGKNLSNAAKIRAVLSDIETHLGAITRFQEKYEDLPGDLRDATSYFKDEDGNDVTEDGDGDEAITWDTSANSSTYQEGALAWQHLLLAGMLDAQTMTGKGGDAVIDENIPPSSFVGAGYYMDNTDPEDGATTIYTFIGFGAQESTGLPDGAVLKPEHAYDVDKKIDDGLPKTGRVRGHNAGGSGCRAGTSPNDTSYDFDQQVKKCYMSFAIEQAVTN